MPYRFEEDHLDRKERKQERKNLLRKDRSKYKKTDASKKQEKKIDETHLLRGRVLAILPEEITVESEGKLFLCSLKGVLKKEFTKVKNLCVVGDFVLFEKTGAIVKVEKRKTQLFRQDSSSKHKVQIIASNIDQVLITVSVMTPPLKPPLIDRFIIASQKGGMEPILLLTKIDLLKKDSPEEALYIETKNLYNSLNIKVLCISAVTKSGMTELNEVMQSKASVFSGESGVGKSSLINCITGLNLPTQEVARKTQRGTHTTVGAKLIPLPCGGWCIDTPGIQSFGLWELQRSDIDNYFFDIQEIGRECKYANCTHTHEPHCAVQEGVKTGKLSLLRFNSYLSMLQEIK